MVLHHASPTWLFVSPLLSFRHTETCRHTRMFFTLLQVVSKGSGSEADAAPIEGSGTTCGWLFVMKYA